MKEEIIAQLKKLTHLENITLETPKDKTLGDFAFPCFELSKIQKKAPNIIASELSKQLLTTDSIKEITSLGPYINFKLNYGKLAGSLIKNILKHKNSFAKQKKKKEKIMVEYSSPNTNKAQHLGHVRNNVLGMALANILEFNGYNTIKTCVMNDRGMGMSKVLVAYKRWGENKKPDIKPDHFVSMYYTMFAKKIEEHPEIEEEAKIMLSRWENKEPEIINMWKKITQWVYQGYEETYKQLGCKFDKTYYESDLYTHGKEIVNKGYEQGILKKEDGAILADLDELGKKVLIKSDGTALYMTQDLYLAEKKFKDFKIDRSIYVVGSEQNLHFQQLFRILKILGYKWADKCYHLSYGMINLPSGKMKSREGTVVDADDIIFELKELARKEIKQRHPEIKHADLEKRAEQIALGAIKFFILKYDHKKDFTYNKEESLSFEGETGPYVQYVHARICSVLEKIDKMPMKCNFNLLEKPEEIKLIQLLNQFEPTIIEAGENYKPHLIARYLIDLAQAFNEFYQNVQILKEETQVKYTRIFLISAVKKIIENGLNILGIEAPNKM